MIKRIFLLLGGLCLLVGALQARAELSIQISKSSDQATPIAVVPFASEGGTLPQDISKIVTDDLRNSGMFSPLSNEALPARPTLGAPIDYPVWQQVKTPYLTVGRVEQAGGGYKVSFELYDVAGQQRMMGESVTVSSSQLRQGAHYVADKIFERITGIRGAFRTKIAYVTASGLGDNQRFGLYVSDQDGYGPQEVLTSNEPILSPSWSPDGHKLAYVSFEGKRPAIYVQDLASGRRLQLTNFSGINGAPAWSPDGRKLAMALSKDGSPDIYVMDLATRSLKQLTQTRSINTEPNFSPDGSALIFTSDRGGQPQIYRMGVGGGDAQRVTFNGRYNAGGYYAPDGKTIFFVTRTDKGYQVAKQDLSTGRMTVLTSSSWDEAPAVAPNGTIVVYATQQGSRGVLNAVSADGRASFVIPSAEGNVREPAWSPFLD